MTINKVMNTTMVKKVQKGIAKAKVGKGAYSLVAKNRIGNDPKLDSEGTFDDVIEGYQIPFKVIAITVVVIVFGVDDETIAAIRFA